MCIAKGLEANVCILSHPLIMSHRFTDALNGDTKWGQGYAADLSDFFKMADRISKSHTLIVFMFIWILSPLCISLLLPHRAQELYTYWITTGFFFVCVASVFKASLTVNISRIWMISVKCIQYALFCQWSLSTETKRYWA